MLASLISMPILIKTKTKKSSMILMVLLLGVLKRQENKLVTSTNTSFTGYQSMSNYFVSVNSFIFGRVQCTYLECQ